jgi:hypothetical protein
MIRHNSNRSKALKLKRKLKNMKNSKKAIDYLNKLVQSIPTKSEGSLVLRLRRTITPTKKRMKMQCFGVLLYSDLSRIPLTEYGLCMK